MSGGWAGSNRSQRLPKDWPKIRQRILKRDSICRLCQRLPSTQVDHIKPGDNHRDNNLAGVCELCHRDKSAREGSTARHKHSKLRQREDHPGSVSPT